MTKGQLALDNFQITEPALSRSEFGIGQPEIASFPGHPIVLYFHSITPSAAHYTAITPQQFAKAIDLLLAKFEPFDLDTLADLLISPEAVKNVSRPTFIITFDDGYRDVLRWGLPILRERNIKAIFFIISDKIAKGGKSAAQSEPYINGQELSDLANEGHLIGSHTVSHRDLSGLPSPVVKREVMDSIDHIYQVSGQQTRLLAYPYGKIPHVHSAVPEHIVGFGTVRAKAMRWNDNQKNIRRTYFPADRTDQWSALVDEWSLRWKKA